jgi:hypothetical protein
MSNINNDPTFGFIGHSTTERGRSGGITAEVIEGSELAEVMNAATITGTQHMGKRKKKGKISWKGEGMGTYPIRMGELSVEEIERAIKGISTKVGFYADANPLMDIPPTEEEEIYDETFWARQRKLLKEKDKFISFDEI